MTDSNGPVKAIIFDIGGVCVRSPLLAIEEYEKQHNIPNGYINFNIYESAPRGAWHRLERNEMPMDATFFTHFTTDLNNPQMWTKFIKEKGLSSDLVAPHIEGEKLFWNMMDLSRELDPYIVPAIKALRQTGRYKLAALTNNYIFPENHPYREDGNLRALFDEYISSAEIGMRKPELRIYQYALKKLKMEDASEVVFVDDLGSNLKGAKQAGLRTVKVPLRETWRAVKELERITGEKLLINHDPKQQDEQTMMVGASKL